MKVHITKDYRDHRKGSVEECTGGQADLLCNVMGIATLVKPEKAKEAKAKAKTAKDEPDKPKGD